jgi:hypothetical protein
MMRKFMAAETCTPIDRPNQLSCRFTNRPFVAELGGNVLSGSPAVEIALNLSAPTFVGGISRDLEWASSAALYYPQRLNRGPDALV